MMKKIILATLLAMFTLAGIFSASVLHAETTIITEETEPIHASELIINGIHPDAVNYEATGYISLTMGLANTVTVSLSDIFSRYEYFSMENVESIQLQVTLDTYYTTAEQGYWNYDDENMSTASENVLLYAISKENIPSTISISFWWANFGSLGGAPYPDTGGLRFLSASMVVTYVNPVDTIDDVDTDYHSLPESVGLFTRITSFELYDELSRSYHMRFVSGGTTYQFDVALPEEILLENFVREDDVLNIAYTTLEDGSRVLYFQPNLNLAPLPYASSGTVEDPQELLAGFVAMNLTTMEYSVVNKLELNSITSKESNSNAYLYAFYDIRVEDIISISIQYSYRYQIAFGISYSDWMTVSNIYVSGDDAEVNPNWWIGYLSSVVYNVLDLFDVYNVDQIEKVTASDIPDDVTYTYVTELGGSTADYSEINLYKIHLGQFVSPLATNYDIQDVVVMNILYVFQGVVYEASTEVISQENITPALSTGIDWMAVVSFLSLHWKEILVVLAVIVGLVLLGKAFKAVAIIFESIFKLIGLLLKGTGKLIEYGAKAIYYFLYFLLYLIPKGIFSFLSLLVTPSSKRKQRKEKVLYVNRPL